MVRLDPAVAALAGGDPGAVIVTAGQRLADTIRAYQASLAAAAGEGGWTGPAAITWSTFLVDRYESALLDPSFAGDLPQLLSLAQARQVWRDTVASVATRLAESVSNPGRLTDAVILAYQRMCEWRIPEAELVAEAHDDDSRFLSACLQEFRRRQRAGHWCLVEELPEWLLQHAAERPQHWPAQVAMAGFVRLTPAQHALCEAIGAQSIPVRHAPAAPVNTTPFESQAEELRAAGAWAARHLASAPTDRVAIVVPDLSSAPERIGREVLAGLAPGSPGHADEAAADHLMSVSLGLALDEMPAVSAALTWCRLVAWGGRFAMVSRLNRSPTFGGDTGQATAFERRLRRQSDRVWTVPALDALADAAARPGWLDAALALHAVVRERHLPGHWAERLDSALRDCGWPTSGTLDSATFQMRNRWRGCLNQLAELDEVLGACTFRQALDALTEACARTVFAPERREAPVLVCGPLEMAGLHFDAIWMSGLDATRWPPAAKPAPLLPAALQRRHAMPDASPEQSAEFWQRQWASIAASSARVTASYARFDGDREQVPTPAIPHAAAEEVTNAREVTGFSGWLGQATLVRRSDRFPVWTDARVARGGHQLLKLLGDDPFAGQLEGRWGLRVPEDPLFGPDARVRGTLLHAALEQLAARFRDHDALVTQSPDGLAQWVEEEAASVFRVPIASADAVSRTLLRREEGRARRLLTSWLEIERTRAPFTVAALETTRELQLEGGLRLGLRADRIDQTPDGLVIIDYKTGQKLPGRLDSLDAATQLAAYALAEERAPAGVVLAGVHPRVMACNGVFASGAAKLPGKANRASLDQLLPEWRQEVEARARRFVQGDAQVNVLREAERWLPFAPLNRVPELREPSDD